MIYLDVPHLFETAGGPKRLLELLSAYVPDHGVPYATVQMWQQRQTIAGRMIPAVLYAMYRHGHTNLLQFLTDAMEEAA